MNQHNPSALKHAMRQCGLIAILRSVRPDEVVAIGKVLYAAGFRVIEVPLNSPEPLTSIRALRQTLPADCLLGAGTVLRAQSCHDVAQAGGQLIVMPHSDPVVIRAAKAAGMACAPGVATATEAFAALAAGADVLKVFPAETVGEVGIKAWCAVLPPDVVLVPVGGIVPERIAAYQAAGARGFGLGSALYRPGSSVSEVAQNAQVFVAAWYQAYPVA